MDIGWRPDGLTLINYHAHYSQGMEAMEIHELREKLEEMTKGIPTRHPERIGALKKAYPHEIAAQGNPNWIDTRTDCFLYAFKDKIAADLVGMIESLVEDNPDLFEKIGERLISEGFISLHEDRSPDDQVVVYFQEKHTKHFRKLVDDRVISKWGRGLVWKHRVFEVPISYGTQVMYSAGQIDEAVLRKVIADFQRKPISSAPPHQDDLTSG